MASFVESTKADFSLSPSERKQRQEIMEAMSVVQEAIKLLGRRMAVDDLDLRSRTIVTSSKESIQKIQSYVEKTFQPVS
jgi:hypothetical protein